MGLNDFQENTRRSARFSRTGVASGVVMQKNMGQIGLRRNYYDACFLAFRARIGSLKKTRLMSITKSAEFRKFKFSSRLDQNCPGKYFPVTLHSPVRLNENGFPQKMVGTHFPRAYENS